MLQRQPQGQSQQDEAQQGTQAEQGAWPEQQNAAEQQDEAEQQDGAVQQWGPQVPADRPYGDEEGLFVASVPDGEEHFSWPDGSEYFGEWRDGQPNGRGIYVSESGSCSICWHVLSYGGTSLCS